MNELPAVRHSWFGCHPFFRKTGCTAEMVHLALGVCVSYLLLFGFKHSKIALRIALWK